MKYSIVKKLAGRRTLIGDDGVELGDFDLQDLELDDAELDELMAKRNPSAVKMRQTAERAALFSECVRAGGGIDLDHAAGLADEAKIGIKGYRQVQKAQELVERAIQDGKFAPADREFISRVALADVARFEEWTRKKPRVVPVGPPVGVTGGPDSIGATPDQELSMRLAQLMSEKNLDRKAALEQLGREEPQVVERYRAGARRVQ